MLPVEAQRTAFAPSSIAFATATTMPRSLNEPVGLHHLELEVELVDAEEGPMWRGPHERRAALAEVDARRGRGQRQEVGVALDDAAAVRYSSAKSKARPRMSLISFSSAHDLALAYVGLEVTQAGAGSRRAALVFDLQALVAAGEVVLVAGHARLDQRGALVVLVEAVVDRVSSSAVISLRRSLWRVRSAWTSSRRSSMRVILLVSAAHGFDLGFEAA